MGNNSSKIKKTIYTISETLEEILYIDTHIDNVDNIKKSRELIEEKNRKNKKNQKSEYKIKSNKDQSYAPLDNELIEAVTKRDLHKTSILLELKANPNVVNHNGNTMLYIACKYGKESLVSKLLEHRAQPDPLKDEDFDTDTDTDIDTDRDDDMLKYVERNGQIYYFGGDNDSYNDSNNEIEDTRSRVGVTVLQEGEVEDIDIKKYIKSDIVVLPYFRNEPLMISCILGHTEIVNYLVSYKADVNKRGSFRYSPLLLATKNKRKDIVKILLDNNANVHATSYRKETAALIAIKNNDSVILKMLLEKKVKINTKNYKKNTVFMEACYNRNYDIIKLLLEHKANPNIQLNISHRANLTIQLGMRHCTPLEYSIHKNDIMIFKELIKHGAYLENIYNFSNDEPRMLLNDEFKMELNLFFAGVRQNFIDMISQTKLLTRDILLIISTFVSNSELRNLINI